MGERKEYQLIHALITDNSVRYSLLLTSIFSYNISAQVIVIDVELNV